MTPHVSQRGKRRIAFLVQGLFEKSDSIGYDAVFQYQEILSAYSDRYLVEIFAERFDAELYPDLAVRPIEEFLTAKSKYHNALIVYHYCDGWPLVDSMLAEHSGEVIVRWHNNTPPWFYVSSSQRSVARTIDGYEGIVKLAKGRRTYFWVNSVFTQKQLLVLGGNPRRISVIYPASRYLEYTRTLSKTSDISAFDPIRLLFVGRMVSHKGHKHLITVARYIQDNFHRAVIVEVVGREDASAIAYNRLIRSLATESEVRVNFRGEVSEVELEECYRQADVFVFLSEHEGFGLPVFEAMRRSLPVVAWARTAVGELLSDHPLCFSNFDVRGFAAAIVQLEDQGVRERVLDIQENILDKYTKQLVVNQVENGFQAAITQWNELDVVGKSEQRELRRLKSTISGRELEWIESTPPWVLPHEEGENYFTLYDLETYRNFSLWSDPSGIGMLSMAGQDPVESVDLPATRFFTDGGAHVGDGISFDCASVVGNHVIYGPYIGCPPGRYYTEFFLKFDGDGQSAVQLRLEVVSQTRGIINSVKFRRSDTSYRLGFSIPRKAETLEFRVKVLKSRCMGGLFSGVRISRAIGVEGWLPVLQSAMVRLFYRVRRSWVGLRHAALPLLEPGIGRRPRR
jgi:glycosyltransferase involved in cell wall biosynthesis